MTAPSVDEYIDRLNDIPEEACSKLYQMRILDRKVLALHCKVSQKRQLALQKILEHQGRPNTRLRSEIHELLKDISDIHHTMLNLSHEKIRLSDEIYDCIDGPTQELNRDLASKMRNPQPVQQVKTSKYKRPNKNNCNFSTKSEQEFFASEPYYCYCHRPSFGLMVKCENETCQVEWFHRDCVDEKNLPERWFCKDCKKGRGKGSGFKSRI